MQRVDKMRSDEIQNLILAIEKQHNDLMVDDLQDIEDGQVEQDDIDYIEEEMDENFFPDPN